MIQNDVSRAALEATRQWAIDELETARVRVTNLRCGGEIYTQAINAIQCLTSLIDNIGYMLGDNQPAEIWPEPLGESLIKAGPNPIDPEPDDPEPGQKPKPAPEPEPEKPAVIIDISEVRTKAKEARDAGVKLPEVWKVFGGAKLSDVPAAKYGELMSLLDSKMKEIGG